MHLLRLLRPIREVAKAYADSLQSYSKDSSEATLAALPALQATMSADSAKMVEAQLPLAQWDSLYYEDWSDARAKRIKLGLDLRGGVYITMEVDVPALLYETADRDLIDDAFETGYGCCPRGSASF